MGTVVQVDRRCQLLLMCWQGFACSSGLFELLYCCLDGADFICCADRGSRELAVQDRSLDSLGVDEGVFIETCGLWYCCQAADSACSEYSSTGRAQPRIQSLIGFSSLGGDVRSCRTCSTCDSKCTFWQLPMTLLWSGMTWPQDTDTAFLVTICLG